MTVKRAVLRNIKEPNIAFCSSCRLILKKREIMRNRIDGRYIHTRCGMLVNLNLDEGI